MFPKNKNKYSVHRNPCMFHFFLKSGATLSSHNRWKENNKASTQMFERCCFDNIIGFCKKSVCFRCCWGIQNYEFFQRWLECAELLGNGSTKHNETQFQKNEGKQRSRTHEIFEKCLKPQIARVKNRLCFKRAPKASKPLDIHLWNVFWL